MPLGAAQAHTNGNGNPRDRSSERNHLNFRNQKFQVVFPTR